MPMRTSSLTRITFVSAAVVSLVAPVARGQDDGGEVAFEYAGADMVDSDLWAEKGADLVIDDALAEELHTPWESHARAPEYPTSDPPEEGNATDDAPNETNGTVEWEPLLPEASAMCAALGLGLLLVSLQVLFLVEAHISRIESILSRAEDECRAAQDASEENNSRLVHIEGQLMRAMAPVADPIFNVSFQSECVRLKRTVEVYQLTNVTAKERHLFPGKHYVERWSDEWHDPEDFPPYESMNTMPEGLLIGSIIQNCSRVQYGGFSMPEDLVTQCCKYVSAAGRISKYAITCSCAEGKLSFKKVGSQDDGYWYHSTQSTGSPSIGDVRVRFDYLPDMTVSVMALQTTLDLDSGTRVATFMPYRLISRPWCGLRQAQLKRELRHEAEKSEERRVEDNEIFEPFGSLCCFCSTCIKARLRPLLPEIFYAGPGSQGMSECFFNVKKEIGQGIVSRRLVRSLRVCIFLGCFSILNEAMGTILADGGIWRSYPSSLLFLGNVGALLVLASLATAACSGIVTAMSFLKHHPASAFVFLLLYALLAGAIVGFVQYISP